MSLAANTFKHLPKKNWMKNLLLVPCRVFQSHSLSIFLALSIGQRLCINFLCFKSKLPNYFAFILVHYLFMLFLVQFRDEHGGLLGFSHKTAKIDHSQLELLSQIPPCSFSS